MTKKMLVGKNEVNIRDIDGDTTKSVITTQGETFDVLSNGSIVYHDDIPDTDIRIITSIGRYEKDSRIGEPAMSITGYQTDKLGIMAEYRYNEDSVIDGYLDEILLGLESGILYLTFKGDDNVYSVNLHQETTEIGLKPHLKLNKRKKGKCQVYMSEENIKKIKEIVLASLKKSLIAKLMLARAMTKNPYCLSNINGLNPDMSDEIFDMKKGKKYKKEEKQSDGDGLESHPEDSNLVIG